MKKQNRSLILAVATIALFFFGFLYSWSVFKTAMLPELGWDNSSVSFAYTLSMVMFSLGILAQGLWPVKSDRTMRILTGAVAVIAGGGMALCGSITQVWQLYLYYGVLFGFGVGFLYNAWIAMAMKHYADQGGFATGILLMGFGVTTFVFSFFSDRFLGETAALGWRGTFVLFGLLIIAVGILALPFFVPPGTGRKQVKKKARFELSPGQMLREPSFYVYTTWKMILKLVGISVAGYATTFAVVLFLKQNPGETMETINHVMVATPLGAGTVLKMAAIGGSLFSVGNGFGRIPIGILHDKIGAFQMLLLIALMDLCGAVLAIVAGRMENFPLLILALLLLGFAYAGVATEGPAFMNEIYGSKNVRANMGINAVTTIPPILIGSKIIGAIYQKTGEFEQFFWITVALCGAAFVVTLALPGCLKQMAKKYGEI